MSCVRAGKAAIDVIGNPLGKSGGSFVQQILIIFLGSLGASTPYLAGIIFFIVAGGWPRPGVMSEPNDMCHATSRRPLTACIVDELVLVRVT
jgi:hypothetical protein